MRAAAADWHDGQISRAGFEACQGLLLSQNADLIYRKTVQLNCIYATPRSMSRAPPISETPQLAALAGELRVAISKLVRRAREQVHAGDFTNSQKSVLLRLERDGPATVSMLARAEGVRPQSMRVTVAALEAAGAVIGKPDPKDGRQTFLNLTPSFVKILRNGRAAKEDWLIRALKAQLAPREHEQLVAAVKLLSRLADF